MEFCEVREIKSDGFILDIYYFEEETDAESYMKICKNECIMKVFQVVPKGQTVKDFKLNKLKLQALSKLSDEEKEVLGL